MLCSVFNSAWLSHLQVRSCRLTRFLALIHRRAEKLQAVHSSAGTFIRDLLREYVADRLTEHLAWDVGRASDFRGLCTAVYMVQKGTTALPSIQALTKWLQESEDFEEDFAQDVHRTFKIFVWMAEDKECSKCFNLTKDNKKLKVSPAEFVSIVVLIHIHKTRLTLRQLSEAIKKMRLNIREVEYDIRLNNRCMKILQNFIKDMEPAHFKPDPGHSCALVAINKLFKGRPKNDELDVELETTTPQRGSGKRKREDNADDDDADYVPKTSTSASQRTPSRVQEKVQVKQSPTAEAKHIPHMFSPPAPPLLPSQPISAPPIPHSQLPQFTQQITHNVAEPFIRMASPTTHLPPQQPQSYQPPSASRIHPDRLAALHAAKSGAPIPQYVPPPREHSYDTTHGYPQPSQPPSVPVSYAPRWEEQPVIRMGPSLSFTEGRPLSPATPHSSAPRSPYTGYYNEPTAAGTRTHQLPPPPHYTPSRPAPNRNDEYYDKYGNRYSNSRY